MSLERAQMGWLWGGCGRGEDLSVTYKSGGEVYESLMNKYPVLFFPNSFANTSVVHMYQVQDLTSLSGYSCYGVFGRLGA